MPPRLPLIRDGFLHLPLFHGTSSLNLSSIRTHGLGGRDLIFDLAVVEFAREFFPIVYSRRQQIGEEWFAKEFELEEFVKQSADHSNWRHGSIYLTSSLHKAVNYSDNQFGSEAIGMAYSLASMLKKIEPQLAQSACSKYEPLFERFEQSGSPILVRVEGAPIDVLRSEIGGAPEPVIANLEMLIADIPEQWESTSQCGVFECCTILPAEQLTFYHLRGDLRASYEMIELVDC